MIAALVHSQGYVSEKQFYALEVAYSDTIGYRCVFLINSPLSFWELKQKHPKMPVQVMVAKRGGVPYEQVVHFLKKRYSLLSAFFPEKPLRFGVKGVSYQSDILDSAQVPYINVERFGVPAIARLERLYPYIRPWCPFHKQVGNRCSESIVRLIEEFSKSFHSRAFCFSNVTTFS